MPTGNKPKTTSILAKDLTEGMKVIGEDGKPLKVTEITRGRGFMVSLEGHKNAYGIMVHYKDRDWSVLHPQQKVEITY